MQLALWIGFCGILAVLTRNHPRIQLSTVLVCWFAVPAVGSPLITGRAGGPVSFHAATWLIAAVAGVQLLHNTRKLTQVVLSHIHVFLSLALVAGAAVIATLSGGGSIVILVDQVLMPAIFFLLILAAGIRDPGLVVALRNMLLLLAAGVSIVALTQAVLGRVIFYESGFLTQYWFRPERGRWMGTIDQPLALSLALCMIAPMVVGLRHAFLQAGLLVLFGGGVVVSQSRVGIVAFGLAVLYVVLRGSTSWRAKIPILAFLGVVSWLFIQSQLSTGLALRFVDDTGSKEARSEALAFFLGRWQDYLLAGGGMSASYKLSEKAGLPSSLESSILMYAVDIGVVFALLYFGLMAVLIVANLRQTVCLGLGIGALVGLLIVQSYSALATRSLAGILIWTFLGMLVVAGSQPRNEPGRKPESEEPPATSPLPPVEAELAAAMRAAIQARE